MDKSYKVYLIEDINDLRYYGMSCQKLNDRFNTHRSKYRNIYTSCSSSRLNLHNSIIICLEDNLTKEEAHEREKYYIRNNECVNKYKYKSIDEIKKTRHENYIKNKDRLTEKQKEYKNCNKEKFKAKQKEYYIKNKETIRIYLKEYKEKNKEKIKVSDKEYREKNKDKIREHKNTIWYCDVCNCNSTIVNKARHFKTQKHIKNLI